MASARTLQSRAEWEQLARDAKTLLGVDVRERKFQWVPTLLFGVPRIAWPSYLKTAANSVLYIREVRPPIVRSDVVQAFCIDVEEYDGGPKVMGKSRYISEFGGDVACAMMQMGWVSACGSFGIVVAVHGTAGASAFILQDWHEVP